MVLVHVSRFTHVSQDFTVGAFIFIMSLPSLSVVTVGVAPIAANVSIIIFVDLILFTSLLVFIKCDCFAVFQFPTAHALTGARGTISAAYLPAVARCFTLEYNGGGG